MAGMPSGTCPWIKRSVSISGSGKPASDNPSGAASRADGPSGVGTDVGIRSVVTGVSSRVAVVAEAPAVVDVAVDSPDLAPQATTTKPKAAMAVMFRM